MSASIRRHAVVLVLIAAAGAAGVGLAGQAAPAPALPAAAALTAGAGQVEQAYAPGDAGGPFREWLVRDADGTQALLYVGATSRVQTMLRWTGELGYQGDGYLVSAWPDGRLRLAGGSTAAVSRRLAQRQADRRLLEYAVVGPEGVAPSATSSLLAAAWDAVSGRAGPYYMVRVSVPAADGAAADRLLATVLQRLLAANRARS
jgi:hypothetical protein